MNSDFVTFIGNSIDDENSRNITPVLGSKNSSNELSENTIKMFKIIDKEST
jgi:hypothetical protein